MAEIVIIMGVQAVVIGTAGLNYSNTSEGFGSWAGWTWHKDGDSEDGDHAEPDTERMWVGDEDFPSHPRSLNLIPTTGFVPTNLKSAFSNEVAETPAPLADFEEAMEFAYD